tara:strand:+ start:77 stop:367 length:291 start_codon:yes stop_codon:yes gene_type:complete
MNRIGGLRRKTRYKLKKGRREKGKVSVSKFMQQFEAGQKVHLTVEPSFHKGMYHPRFKGKTGIIKTAIGNCYEVAITDGGKQKTLLIHPIHLKTAR